LYLLTRDLAERFNNAFGKTFVVPQPIIRTAGARIMGLDDPAKKMSKSADSAYNYIALTDSPDEIHRKTATLAAGLVRLGFAPANATFFDTLTAPVGTRQRQLIERAVARGVNLRIVGDSNLGISLDETTTDETIETLWAIFGGELRLGVVELVRADF